MKNLELILKKIEKRYNINDLFSYALFHRYENVERIYLDEFELSGINLFLFLIDFVVSRINQYFSNSFYICLVEYNKEQNKSFSKKNKNQLKLLQLEIPKELIQKNYYSNDDECYVNLYFYEESFEKIKIYLWGLLACSFSIIEPNLQFGIFFISKDLSTLVHVYDDRGMDIMKLDLN